MVDILRRSFVRDNQQKLNLLKNLEKLDCLVDVLCARSVIFRCLSSMSMLVHHYLEYAVQHHRGACDETVCLVYAT